LGQLFGFAGRLGQLDAPRLAAAAHQHLALNHHAPAQLLGDVARFLRRRGHAAPWNGDAARGEQQLRLIFVQFQQRLPA
jgi:hypothetical protein